jgi:hypothetical protein
VCALHGSNIPVGASDPADVLANVERAAAQTAYAIGVQLGKVATGSLIVLDIDEVQRRNHIGDYLRKLADEYKGKVMYHPDSTLRFHADEIDPPTEVLRQRYAAANPPMSDERRKAFIESLRQQYANTHASGEPVVTNPAEWGSHPDHKAAVEAACNPPAGGTEITPCPVTYAESREAAGLVEPGVTHVVVEHEGKYEVFPLARRPMRPGEYEGGEADCIAWAKWYALPKHERYAVETPKPPGYIKQNYNGTCPDCGAMMPIPSRSIRSRKPGEPLNDEERDWERGIQWVDCPQCKRTWKIKFHRAATIENAAQKSEVLSDGTT